MRPLNEKWPRIIPRPFFICRDLLPIDQLVILPYLHQFIDESLSLFGRNARGTVCQGSTLPERRPRVRKRYPLSYLST